MTFSCLLVVLILMATTQHSIAQSSDQFALSTSQHAALMAVWDKMDCQGQKCQRFSSTQSCPIRSGAGCKNGVVNFLEIVSQSQLPSEIALLTGLTTLYFCSTAFLLSVLNMTRSRGTGLIGSLPSTLKQLTRLTWAIGRSLSGSGGLTGPFPTAVLDVKSLTFLSLSNNDLTGTIPSLDALSLLTSVDLSKNKFEGAAPPPPASVKSCTFDTSISESNCFSSCTALCCGGTKRCSSALAPSGMASECDSSMVQAYAGCEAAYQQCSDPRLDTAVVCKCHEMFGTCLAGLGSDCVQVVRAIDSVRDACMAQRCSSDCYLASFGSPQSVPLTGIYVAVGVVGGLFIIGMVALYVYNMRRAHRMMMEQQEQQQQNPVVINSRMQTETPAP